MIIDFHTHTFPDKIAAKTIDYLAKKGNVTPYSDGTLSSLKESMKKSGVDYSVILPVATAANQTASINRLAAELNGKDGIFYAGAIHPECENVDEILDFIKRSGLFGIKLHPDYQNVYFDDERYINIMKKAAKRNLFIVTHAGIDVAYPNDIHCTPEHVLNVLEKLKGEIDNKLILAHLGGFRIGREVLEKLAGKPVYMDTAVVLDEYPEICQEIIKAHGCSKILFATDFPWADQSKYVQLLQNYNLTEYEQEQIFWENGKKILNSTGNLI